MTDSKYVKEYLDKNGVRTNIYIVQEIHNQKTLKPHVHTENMKQYCDCLDNKKINATFKHKWIYGNNGWRVSQYVHKSEHV